MPNSHRLVHHRPKTVSPARSESLEQRRLLSTAISDFHGDAGNLGTNLTETSLTAANVNVNTFGKLFSDAVDGQAYAQPLYQPGVTTTTGNTPGVHNVVYVATQGDSLYAFDSRSGTLLWQDSFLVADPALGAGVTVTTVPNGDVSSGDINPQIGITSTPVIDSATGYLFLTAKTKQVIGGGLPHYVYTLEKVNIASGVFTGTVIGDTTYNSTGSVYTYNSGPYVFDPHGAGAGVVTATINGTSQKVIYFNALRQLNRPGLSLYNGNVYIAFASHGDNGPYHGWILSYSETSLTPTAVLNLNPDGSDDGVWQSAGKIAMDSSGNMYVETGNGTFDTTLNASGFPQYGDYGTSFVKFAVDPTTSVTNQNINGWGLKVVDYFTPYNEAGLSGGDTDLGSGGPLVLPATIGSVILGGASDPNLLLGSGKNGVIYVLNQNNMGHFSASTNHDVQEIAGGVAGNGSYDTPALFYDGTNAYLIYVGNNAHAQEYIIANGAISAQTSGSSVQFSSFGPSPLVSANGTSNGIAWMIDSGAGKLRAYQADNLGTEYYDSGLNSSRDALGAATKFSAAAVADGRVFVGTSSTLVVYGLLTSPVTLTGPVNYIRLDANGSTDVYNNSTGTGTPVQYIPSSITVTGSSAASSLIVDLSAGNPLPSSGLTYNGSTGGGTLTILGTSGNDTLTAGATSATFNTIAINYSHIGGLIFNGGLGSDTLTQSAGAPPLTFAATTVNDTLAINGGVYTFAAPPNGAGDVSQSLATLTIASGAKAVLGTNPTNTARTILNLSSLSIAGSNGNWFGTFDIGGNSLAISTGTVAQQTNQIMQGYSNGAWTGTGIISSTAAGEATHRTTVGLISSSPSGVLAAYTYYGDANLDGKVDGSDYSRIDSGYSTAGSTGWNNGDFNYDGVIDGSDYTLIDNAFNSQGAVLSAMIATPAAGLAKVDKAAILPLAHVKFGNVLLSERSSESLFNVITVPTLTTENLFTTRVRRTGFEWFADVTDM